MTKIIKYLKPFTVTVLIAFALLYLQAMADLALPDYMSNIVNNGIQKNGVDQAIPEVFIEEDFTQLLYFAEDNGLEILKTSYRRLDLNLASDKQIAVELTKKYPLIENENIYVINKVSKNDKDTLEIVLSKAFIQIGIASGQTPNMDLDTLDQQSIIQMGTYAVGQYLVRLGADLESLQRHYILKTGGFMLLISLVGALASILVGLIAARVASGVGRNLRKAIFTKVEGFSNVEFDKFSTASLITRSTNDITQIQTLLVMMIRMLFYAPIMGLGGVIRALDKSTSMSWIIAVAVIVLLGIIMIVFSIALPKFKAIQSMIDQLNLVVRENLTGMMVIRAFNTQKFEEKRFDQANQDLTRINLFVNRVMTFMFPVMMLIMNGVSLLIIWVGAHQIEASNMQVGDMMAFMQYAMQIIMSFLMLSMMFIMVPRATVSAGRVAEVLEMDATIFDPKDPITLNKSGKGTVEFKNVSFKYPGAEEDVLKNITFNAKAGDVTAIIGSTGAGKSTLVNLIPRFYDVVEGEITIDGISIRSVLQNDLRSMIGYVPQKAALFSGTIESNLKVGNQVASNEMLATAIQIAQATEIVNEKPEGMQAPIAQSGSNLSGGQKQRLSIARALVKQPKIFIFDDAFSALDYKTDMTLRAALRKQTNHATVILVAQRISTIKDADQIIVLDEGRIVGTGTHDTLMSTCQTYQEIAMSQLSLEELS